MIMYTADINDVEATQLSGFAAARPEGPCPETQTRWLRTAHAAVVAIDEATGKVVGFATAMTRGVMSCFITQLEVLPAYHAHGVRQELAGQMLVHLARS